VLIGGFIGAAIAFVVWKLMGSVENYETAYRCCAYASAISPVTTLLGIIPYLGSIIGILMGTYYIVMASVEVHRIPAKKAWTVFGIIAAVLILLSLSGQFAARKMAGDAERFKKEMKRPAGRYRRVLINPERLLKRWEGLRRSKQRKCRKKRRKRCRSRQRR